VSNLRTEFAKLKCEVEDKNKLIEGPVVYDKMPREVTVTREKDDGLHMWEQQWMDTGKGAVTKAFFPSVRNRLLQKFQYS